jgi:dolichyl-phosphate beta-glucosyltransferase
MDVSIVIPAFKEAHKIEPDIAAADAFLRTRANGGEIILVDDGSPDGTADAALALQTRYPALQVVRYAPNRGKGYAIAQGVARAKGDVVMFADAGLCVPYDIAALGLTMLQLDMCDIAHGSRRMRGSILRAQPLYRRAGSRAYKFVVHAFMGIPGYISDTQCGFKLYRRDVAQKLFSQLLTDGFMFDVEIIMRALRERYRILEFPVLWSNDADTRYDPVKGTIRNFGELARIRWALATERPR